MGAQHCLHPSLRRMNEHIKNRHEGGTGLSGEQFGALATIQASKSGHKASWIEILPTKTAAREQEDYRSESILESKLRLLKTYIFHIGEENSSEHGDFFCKIGDTNMFKEDVVSLMTNTTRLCQNAGAEIVRQQAMRNAENQISSKSFLPVQPGSVVRDAGTVAQFVFFCSKAPWDAKPKELNTKNILSNAFFERNTTITQTFMMRLV